MALDLGLSVEAFLAEHWQRRPLLARGALANLEGLIDRDELAGLACEDYAESRVVTGPDAEDRYHLEHGPIAEARFAELGDRNWTLLVQDAEKFFPELQGLLEPFRFLPDWRVDDVMVSFAAPGGSVGPHVDQYDVFLIQAEGTRRWAIDERPEAPKTLRADSELELLEQFDASDEWLLQPGDLLYLPPGVAHHGVAESPCLTFSVGFRSPAVEELVIDYAEHVAAGLDDALRYADPPLAADADPGEITAAAQGRLRALLTDALALEPADFADWVGSFLTRYRLAQEVAAAPELAAAAMSAPLSAPLQRHPYGRLAWSAEGDEARLFASGRVYRCSRRFASMLCRERRLEADDLADLDEAERKLLRRLIARGEWVPVDA